MMRWPDVTRVTVRYLSQATGARTVTRLPANLESNLPIFRVTRGPGSDDLITDAPVMDVEVFASSEAAMWTAAEGAREAMHALAGVTFEGALVDSVRTVQSPVYVDYDNPAIYRAISSYRLTLRKR